MQRGVRICEEDQVGKIWASREKGKIHAMNLRTNSAENNDDFIRAWIMKSRGY